MNDSPIKDELQLLWDEDQEDTRVSCVEFYIF